MLQPPADFTQAASTQNKNRKHSETDSDTLCHINKKGWEVEIRGNDVKLINFTCKGPVRLKGSGFEGGCRLADRK